MYLQYHAIQHSTHVSVPRENENLITSFIDASTVYGSTAERQERLRNPNRSKTCTCNTLFVCVCVCVCVPCLLYTSDAADD